MLFVSLTNIESETDLPKFANYFFVLGEAEGSGKESEVPNTVLWEINAWEKKLKRFETMEAQLNMPGVQVRGHSYMTSRNFEHF